MNYDEKEWAKMRISYDYYRIFYYVARYGSFSKAAEALLCGQPNITKTINNLEAQLGCKLFLRSNKGVTLTPEGEKLFEHAEIAFERLYRNEIWMAGLSPLLPRRSGFMAPYFQR